MSLLSHVHILEVRRAVLAARLGDSRQALLSGISHHLKASLPSTASPGDQVLCDLDSLNTVAELEDGTVPLVLWLSNAVELAGNRKQSAVFRQMLGLIERRGTQGPAPPVRGKRRRRTSVQPVQLQTVPTGSSARAKPTNTLLRREFHEAIGADLLRRFREQAPLDEADLYFADTILGEVVAKFMRLKQLERRVEELAELPPSTGADDTRDEQRSVDQRIVTTNSNALTSSDWLNRFREDASLVDDEVVREIYARVLHQENARPGSFSLRTLRVLRYLDQSAAVAFAKLQSFSVSDAFVPADENLHNACGLSHGTLIDLHDAGLLNFGVLSYYRRTAKKIPFSLRAHQLLVALTDEDDGEVSVSLPVHLFTVAGRELSRIAHTKPSERSLKALLRWFRGQAPAAELLIASASSLTVDGSLDSLPWTNWNDNQSADGAG